LDQEIIFERYSDSAASFVVLDSDKPQVYKTLFRAAKAKLKLRLRATIPGDAHVAPPAPPAATQEPIPSPLASLHRMSSDTLTPQAAAPVSPVIAHSPSADPPAPKFEPISPISPAKQATAEGEAPVPRPFSAEQRESHKLI
jgi:next-to-BRCA1 protein 1